MTIVQPILASSCGCDRADGKATLISLDEALALIKREAPAIGETELVPLAQAKGRVLATAVRALGMTPPFDNAAMDGYALHTSALSGDGPWTLEVTGRVAAGQAPASALQRDSAVQIFTGAPLPKGADAVVMQEDVERLGSRITLNRIVLPGSHIRKAGEDMTKGKIVLPSGRCLTARDIAACAAAGHSSVMVTRCLRVALLVTGDEVVQQGKARQLAGIWDVNTPMLASAAALPFVKLVAVQHQADSRESLQGQLQRLAGVADLIMTTGGISVGEEDHVKPALLKIGGKLVFSGVALKPGKPVSFGKLGSAFWLGLPGNPLSAFVTWQIFGRALCEALAGQSFSQTPRRNVILARSLHHKAGRCELRLARLAGCDGNGRDVVQFGDTTHSGRVSELATADGLLFIPADAETLPSGAMLEFLPF